MVREVLVTELVLALFALACGYCLGRADRIDLGPWKRHPKDLDSHTVVQLHRHAARKSAPRRRG